VAHQFAEEPLSGGGLAADPLAELASAGGYEDPERWWDDVIEHRRDGASPFEVIAEAMGALRETEESVDTPAGKRERRREAFMRLSLRRAKKDGFQRIVVVCGAWHVPALTEPLPPASRDQAILKGLPKRKVSCTWVPWTHSRLAASSGYGAGVTSPGWYRHLFTAADHVTARWLTDVAGVLRAEDLPVSSAHVIEAVRLADTLTALRGRALPGLEEVTEATRSVLCDGDDVRLDLVTRRLVVGELLGEVPPETPQAPVAADLTAAVKRLRLRRDPLVRELDLDLRNPTGAERSQLLHRLRILGVGWAVPEPARRGKGTFRETWTLCWRPEFEVDLVAAGVHGTTVFAAAVSVVRAAVAEATTLADITGAVEDCLLSELDTALPDVLAALDRRAATDSDVANLMAALPALARASRYGTVRGTDTGALRTVGERMVVRVCAGLPSAAHGLDEDAAARLCGLVDGVHEAAGLLGEDTRERWLVALESLARRETVAPRLGGRVTRILYDAERTSASEVELRLGRALTPGIEPANGAAYIEGFFDGGALLLVHDDRLLRVLDGWLSAVPPALFTEVLPLLRRTFGAFAAPERRTIGERAAGLSGQRAPVERVVEDFDERRAESVLPVLATLLGVGR
jgi:hypothetical protein